MDASTLLDDVGFEALRPGIRDDALVRHFDTEIVVWSPTAPAPVYLDPVAALVLQLLDGDVPVSALVAEVHEVLGIPKGIARNQLRRAITLLTRGGILTSSATVEQPDLDVDIFAAPPNP